MLSLQSVHVRHKSVCCFFCFFFSCKRALCSHYSRSFRFRDQVCGDKMMNVLATKLPLVPLVFATAKSCSKRAAAEATCTDKVSCLLFAAANVYCRKKKPPPKTTTTTTTNKQTNKTKKRYSFVAAKLIPPLQNCLTLNSLREC